MTFEEKINFMHKDFAERGLKKSQYSTPFYRLLWKFNIKAKPIYFDSIISVFFKNAIAFGIFFSLFTFIMNRFFSWNMKNNLFALLLSSTFVGVFSTITFKYRASKLNLPKWEDYGE